MVARNRLPPWHEEIRLRNGREVLIRPIRPEDAPALRAGFELLEPAAVRGHLLRGAPMGVEQARMLAQPDTRTQFTLVVSEPLPPGDAMIAGLGTAAMLPDAREATLAILIGRNVAGMGLARHLLRRLARWARGKRLQALQGDVPEDNGPLLDLARSMGFAEVEGADPGFIRIRLPLAAAMPTSGVARAPASGS